MNLTEHIDRRVLPALLCLGMFVNSTLAMADGELHDVAAATKAGNAASEMPMTATPASSPVATVKPAEPIFVTVNGKPIYMREFRAHYAKIMRDRFYHGHVPADQMEAVLNEVSDFLIENALLVEEAERRGFKPDAATIERVAADAEARYGATPGWQENREKMLSGLREQTVRQLLIEQAKKALRDVPQPTPAEVRAYYEQKPELFTEPEKLSLSMILLSVDPGAPKADWDKAREEAQRIKLRIKDKADFAEQARLHSSDKSASSGGSLGYVHGGMLPEILQGKVDQLQVGVVAEPMRVLQGIALYRLDERVAPKLQEFKDVEQRAQELLKREEEDRVWKDAIGRLRRDAKVEIIVPIKNDGGKQGDSGMQKDNKKNDSKKSDSKKKGGKKKGSGNVPG